MTQLENKAFSVKSTQYMRLERSKEPYKTVLRTRKTRYVAICVVTDTQIHRHTHKTTTVTLTHAPRVKNASVYLPTYVVSVLHSLTLDWIHWNLASLLKFQISYTTLGRTMGVFNWLQCCSLYTTHRGTAKDPYFIIILELCRAHTPCAHCAICRSIFVCKVKFYEFRKMSRNAQAWLCQPKKPLILSLHQI